MALNPKVGVGYNAQVAVDSKHKLIVEQEVTNAGTDLGLLAPTATAAKEALEADKIKAVADSGYYKGEDIAACEAAGIEAYVPRPQRGFAVRERLFRKEEFHYDAQNDVYVCPGNQQLHPRYRSSGGEHDRIYYCNRDACRHCELKSRCTTNPYRQVARWIDEAVLDRMETRLKANPHILRQRRELVEQPFGSIKQWMNQGAFLMRGLEKVRAEFSLTALAYNMTRVLTIVGIERTRWPITTSSGSRDHCSALRFENQSLPYSKIVSRRPEPPRTAEMIRVMASAALRISGARCVRLMRSRTASRPIFGFPQKNAHSTPTWASPPMWMSVPPHFRGSTPRA